jgi:hypothetical protein
MANITFVFFDAEIFRPSKIFPFSRCCINPFDAKHEISCLETLDLWFGFIFCLIRSVKETCPAISQQLKLTIGGFSTVEIVRYHGNIRREEGFLK